MFRSTFLKVSLFQLFPRKKWVYSAQVSLQETEQYFSQLSFTGLLYLFSHYISDQDNNRIQKLIQRVLKPMPKKAYSEGQICSFVLKLWSILENQEYNHILLWDSSGKSFKIINPVLLQTKILPIYFRHSQLKSFVRQLNMYHFNKSERNKEILIFFNPNFRKFQPQRLPLIRRKLAKKQTHLCQNRQSQILEAISELQSFNDARGQSEISNAVEMEYVGKNHFQHASNHYIIHSHSRIPEYSFTLIPLISPFSYASIASKIDIAPCIKISDESISADTSKQHYLQHELVWEYGITSCENLV